MSIARRPKLMIASAVALSAVAVGVPQANAQGGGAGASPSQSEMVFAPTALAVPGVQPAGARSTEKYLSADGSPLPMVYSALESSAIKIMGTSAPSRTSGRASISATCTPGSGVDNPHISETAVFAVHGHGWWTNGNCRKTTARVFNCLYEYYTDNSWRRKGCSSKQTLRPGGGSSARTTASRDCDTSDRTDWRNHVDVDVIDESDTGEQPFRQASVPCRYWGPDA